MSALAEPVFRLEARKYTGETSVISVRLPKDMLRDIDAAAAAAGRTRNELLTMSMEFALNHIEIITEKERKHGDH
ncbi:MAG: ribbon-helix-helix protein, CopG family [Oscillospiraceae bacterium]|nr:ribbon-helix-helix protein, CopG family [Oscillospiraceae bacterium]